MAPRSRRGIFWVSKQKPKAETNPGLVSAPETNPGLVSRANPPKPIRDWFLAIEGATQMVTRRDFLSAAAVTTGAALVPAISDAQTPAPTPAPPSIAALSSARDLAKPITNDERLARVDNARRLMTDQKMGAVLLAGGTSTVYFTNVRWWLSERFFGVFVTAKGDHFAVCPAFEEERAREQLTAGPLGAIPVLTWHEHESPYALAAKGLRDRGLGTAAIGIEETVRWVFSESLAKAAPTLSLVSGTPITAGCRGIKTAHEIELMRLAARVTLKAYDAAWKALREGMTQNDFGALVSAAHAKLGFQGSAGVQTGVFAALPHGSVTPQVIREGTILLIDGGCSIEGYSSDISRTFVLGKPTDKMKRVFDIVRKAQDAALKTARPGVAAEAVDAAARKVVEDGGYGPAYNYFSHRLGHGMGMDGHEWPYLVKGNTMPLAPGMTFSNEPGIYIRGEFGVRTEDDMLITPAGAELFTPQAPSLEDPFGSGTPLP
jgi:Xaa-Pro dipeptidase